MSWLKGIVSRALPQAFSDLNPTITRMSRYGDSFGIPLVRKQHALADEGSYFVANNNTTNVVGPLSPSTFLDVNPGVVGIITNSDSPSNQNNKRMYVDWLLITVTAAGAAASGLTNLNFLWTIDNTDRYLSGGTDLVAGIWNANMDAPIRSSVARARFGAMTIGAATGARRFLSGQRQLRQQNSGTAMAAVQDTFLMKFGSVESTFGSTQLDLTTAKTTAGNWQFDLPPMIIGPNQCALLHMWSPGAALTTGISFLPELGWWER